MSAVDSSGMTSLATLEHLVRGASDSRSSLLQLLLAARQRDTLNRIVRCPTYPVVRHTPDLKNRLELLDAGFDKSGLHPSSVLSVLIGRSTPATRRKAKGQFFTPYETAQQAVWILRPQPGEVILDAGSGTSVLASALLQTLDKTAAEVCYLGIENDPISALAGALALDLEGAPPTWKILYANFLLVDRAELASIGIGKVSAVISNPPFVRHHDIEDRQRLAARVRATSQADISKLAGVQIYFLAHSASIIDPSGRMLFLLPSETIGAFYGLKLLDQMKRRFRISVELVRPLSRRPGLKAEEMSPALSIMIHFESAKASSDEPPQSGRPERPKTLTLIARVHRGLSTGANDYFVLPQSTVESLAIERKYLERVVPTRVRLPEIQFTLADWQNLRDQDKPCWLLTIPPRASHDELSPELRNYLTYGVRIGVPRRPTSLSRTPWYSIGLPPKPDFFFTYLFRERAHVVYNVADVHILTNLLGIHLKSELNLRPEQVAWVVGEFDRALQELTAKEIVGRRYRGGLRKLEPSELESLPIPDDLESLLSGPHVF